MQHMINLTIILRFPWLTGNEIGLQPRINFQVCFSVCAFTIDKIKFYRVSFDTWSQFSKPQIVQAIAFHLFKIVMLQFHFIHYEV